MYPESLVALYLGLPYTSNQNEACLCSFHQLRCNLIKIASGRDVTGEVDVLNEGVLSMLGDFVEVSVALFLGVIGEDAASPFRWATCIRLHVIRV
ncbi:hypothetical protein FOXG_21598 [Fusarium oxysporum f. sp. lycopersici 4287]|uniref:Uncharacterized protein n=1 Tax=Fusarium oxysporum f. sp. lycopersici (strain 4287 / CBS 123668 / FGSC 9935 / NRRL 34936) TaxID=426428 RepID=A0A0J9VZ08_FUSO4|nr:hypothetical protein FOXG_21598 [Fusarium oxysporum f. sp. lycopersici 4287]KNB16194.1 hypothetical protein FOXG_21598 [Fusarium oxysporum f. sp. lycopersici 4287]